MQFASPIRAGIVALTFASALAVTAQERGTLTIAEGTRVPGGTLHSGTYSISVVDHLNDRTVLRMERSGHGSPLIFLGVSGTGMPGAPGAAYWEHHLQGSRVLRGYSFSSGKALEFVYPKADAVAIAKANETSVVAIDPGSEGRPELTRFSPEDRQIIGLWLLTPTKVTGASGTEQSAMDAKKFVPPAGGPAEPAVASSTTPKKSPPPSSSAVARASAPAAATQLPKTASDLPLVWAAGALSLATAFALRLRRVRVAA